MERRAPVTDTERQQSRKRPDRYANLQEMEKIEDYKNSLIYQLYLLQFVKVACCIMNCFPDFSSTKVTRHEILQVRIIC